MVRHMKTKLLIKAATLGLIVTCALPPLSASSVVAARPDGLSEPDALKPIPSARQRSGATILEVQKALSEMGYYLGDIDGHLNRETEAAVRIYQQTMGQKIDGQITRQLWDLLNNAVQVRGLLKRLDKARQSGKDKARAALLSHSATRDLIRDNTKERADPTRNVEACFANPTVRCLLAESRESVKAVFKPELRDWALGEILVAQARAGLSERAMNTAAGIRDPRLIVVALRDIAQALASTGIRDEALEAVKIIPDGEKRAEALSQIAQIYARQGDHMGVRAAADALLSMIEELDPPSKQIPFKMNMALVLHQAKSPIRTAQLLQESEVQARTLIDETQRSFGLRHIATTLAGLGRPQEALTLLSKVSTTADREPVLVAIAKAMADNGDPALALTTAADINPRYRATVLSHIAYAQAQSTGTEALEQTLELASQSIDKIKLPYARSFARSRLALTISRIGDLKNPLPDSKLPSHTTYYFRASQLAAKIEDNRLRAYTLWSIGQKQRRAGDPDGAKATETLANDATGEIKSRLSRVWMFADLAAQSARIGDTQMAWDAFNRGLQVGKTIDNAWGRSRALAKLAQTLIELVAPGQGQEEVSYEQ